MVRKFENLIHLIFVELNFAPPVLANVDSAALAVSKQRCIWNNEINELIISAFVELGASEGGFPESVIQNRCVWKGIRELCPFERCVCVLGSTIYQQQILLSRKQGTWWRWLAYRCRRTLFATESITPAHVLEGTLVLGVAQLRKPIRWHRSSQSVPKQWFNHIGYQSTAYEKFITLSLSLKAASGLRCLSPIPEVRMLLANLSTSNIIVEPLLGMVLSI